MFANQTDARLQCCIHALEVQNGPQHEQRRSSGPFLHQKVWALSGKVLTPTLQAESRGKRTDFPSEWKGARGPAGTDPAFSWNCFVAVEK